MRTNKALFLDIDGVLNRHIMLENGYCGIDPFCVWTLNKIFKAVETEVVISSAWRYMMLGKQITDEGFTYLLRTHGYAGPDIAGHTIADESEPMREDQIYNWLDRFSFIKHWAVLDDLDLDFGLDNWRFVKTDGFEGITKEHTDKVVGILKNDETS